MPTTLFREVDEIIRSFDPSKDYNSDLPTDLQEFMDIINVASKNGFLGLNGQDEIPAVCFNMCYAKQDEGYKYNVMTRDENYNEILETTTFEKMSDDDYFYYEMRVNKREDAVSSLSQINTRAKKIMKIKSNIDNYFFEYQDANILEYDEDNKFHI